MVGSGGEKAQQPSIGLLLAEAWAGQAAEPERTGTISDDHSVTTDQARPGSHKQLWGEATAWHAGARDEVGPGKGNCRTEG